MRRLAALLIGLWVLPASVMAVELPVETDRLLWCGSAFYWLSVDAYDGGDNEEGDQYQAWSDELTARATTLLEAGGDDETQIEAIRDDYDTRVVAEMDTPNAKYDVMTCPDLVTPAGQ